MCMICCVRRIIIFLVKCSGMLFFFFYILKSSFPLTLVLYFSFSYALLLLKRSLSHESRKMDIFSIDFDESLGWYNKNIYTTLIHLHTHKNGKNERKSNQSIDKHKKSYPLLKSTWRKFQSTKKGKKTQIERQYHTFCNIMLKILSSLLRLLIVFQQNTKKNTQYLNWNIVTWNSPLIST